VNRTVIGALIRREGIITANLQDGEVRDMIPPMLAIVLACLAFQDPQYDLTYLPVHGRRMDTFVHDYNGDGKPDLLNTSVDFDQEPPVRWISVHVREGSQLSTLPSQMIPIDDRAAALILGDLLPGGGIEFGFVAPDGVYVYPFANGAFVETPTKILHLRTFYTTVSPRAIPVWSGAIDLDKDGRHDLVVPTHTGYRVYFQTASGQYGQSAEMEADLANEADRALAAERFASRPERLVGHFTTARELPHLTAVDIDGDGRLDLVTLKHDVLTYFFQKQPRVFSSKRRSRVSYQIATLTQEMKKDALDVAMISFLDYNQDRAADLVVTRVVGQLGLLESLETRVYLHPGTGRGNFSSDKCLLVRGVSIDPKFADMNEDGALDCMVSRLRTDLLSQGGQLLVLGDIPITYEVFQFDRSKGMYFADPVFDKKVLVNKDDLGKRGAATVPLLFVQGDLSGDGRPDMVFIDPSVGELQIMRGRAEGSRSDPLIGFEPGPVIRKKLEHHPKAVILYDINADGWTDVLLLHSGQVGVLQSKK